MDQRERNLIVFKAMLLKRKEAGKKDIDIDFLLEKIDVCLEEKFPRPEVLLDEEEKKRFDSIVEDLRNRGKII